MDAVFARVSTDEMNMVRAGRLYANVSLAMLTAYAPVDDGAARLLSLVQGPPKPKVPEVFDPEVAAIAAGTTVARRLLATRQDRLAVAAARDTALARLTAGMESDVISGSVDFGAGIAKAVVARAASDGASRAARGTASVVEPSPGSWVPTPPDYLASSEPGWGSVRRFLKVWRQCPVGTPVPGADPASPYEKEATVVKEVAATLTEQQRLVALFWDDSPGSSGTTVGHWVNIALSESARKGRGSVSTVVTLASASMSMADALAGAWRARHRTPVERPVTVIQRTYPEWSPLLVTPSGPGHPSAHAAASRAAAEVLTHFLGESAFHDPGFGVPARSRAAAGVKKQVFESFAAAARQAGQSRVYGGVEFPMSVRSGDRLGRCIGAAVVDALGGD